VFIRITLIVAMRDLGYRLRRALRRAGQTVLADRQVLMRSHGRMRALTLGWRAQAIVLLTLLAAVGWIVHASVARIENGRIIAAKEHEIGSLKLAFRSLRSDVDRSETRFTVLARTLEAKHAYLVEMLGRETIGDDAARSLGVKTRAQGHARIHDRRQALLAQLGKLEMVLQGTARTEGRNTRERLAIEERLHITASDRVRMDRERRALVARLEKLEAKLAAVNVAQGDIASRMAERTIDQVDRIKGLIVSTGVNVEALLARLGPSMAPGLGGPFVAADGTGISMNRTMSAGLGSLDHHLGRLDNVRRLTRVLPLARPSEHYYVASGFGKRRDPLNRRWAMHYGVDLAGVYRSPVLATASGRVVSVGWNGNYGRMIEIDHGMGVRTRYGHLRRILVKRGQKVELHQKIGQMGTSGRSTGTHLHYEVSVNGKPQDPMKFLQAGEYVLKGL
jgi:murein DD-endopeptidase MepM/ murein hydrolase activator NlpD